MASSGLAAGRLASRPSGLRASALPLRRRGALRVSAIAAPAEELLGQQAQPKFEVREPVESALGEAPSGGPGHGPGPSMRRLETLQPHCTGAWWRAAAPAPPAADHPRLTLHDWSARSGWAEASAALHPASATTRQRGGDAQQPPDAPPASPSNLPRPAALVPLPAQGGRELANPPPFTLQDMRDAIPAECFEKDTFRSFGAPARLWLLH